MPDTKPKIIDMEIHLLSLMAAYVYPSVQSPQEAARIAGEIYAEVKANAILTTGVQAP